LSAQSQFDALLNSLYKDSHLKNRLILWTFLGLVLPLSFLVAIGLPEKAACVIMIALVPFLFLMKGRNRKSKTASIVGFGRKFDPQQKQPETNDAPKERKTTRKAHGSARMLAALSFASLLGLISGRTRRN